MNKGYLAVIEEIGNAILSKNLEMSILRHENENLKVKIDALEMLQNKEKE